jgi:hypothetical protein
MMKIVMALSFAIALSAGMTAPAAAQKSAIDAVNA